MCAEVAPFTTSAATRCVQNRDAKANVHHRSSDVLQVSHGAREKQRKIQGLTKCFIILGIRRVTISPAKHGSFVHDSGKKAGARGEEEILLGT